MFSNDVPYKVQQRFLKSEFHVVYFVDCLTFSTNTIENKFVSANKNETGRSNAKRSKKAIVVVCGNVIAL